MFVSEFEGTDKEFKNRFLTPKFEFRYGWGKK